MRDEKVFYNPNPFSIAFSIYTEVKDTLSALVGGYLSPKWLSGPVGIIHIMQKQWHLGFKELLFWLGTISLNLALLNLLPLPVLDGGYATLSLFEIVTGKRVTPETIEKFVWPFVILLIGFMLYLTYHDIERIFFSLFS